MRYNRFRKLYAYNHDVVLPAFEKAGKSADSPNDVWGEIDKICYCGNIVNTTVCDSCGTNHFRSFNRCKSKFCRLCQSVKSSLWTAHLVSWIWQWINQGNYVVFVNFTIKDTDNLVVGLNQLYEAWSFMTGKNAKYKKMFFDTFVGGFRSVEVKTGKNSGQWHPHIHTICLKSKYSDDVDLLRYLWFSSVSRAGGVCTFHPYFATIKNKDSKVKRKVFGSVYDLKRNGIYMTSDEYKCLLASNVREVCKYITKFDWEKEKPSRLLELFRGLKGRRQYAVWGQLRKLRDEVEKAFDTKTNEEIHDFVCQVCGCEKGHKNKLYDIIWSNDEPYIKEYKNTRPENLATGAELEKIRIANKYTDFQQKNRRHNWVQEHINFNDTSNFNKKE